MTAFKHGRNTRVLLGAYELSNMLREYTFASQYGTADTTAFTNDVRTFVTGVGTGTVAMSGMFSSQGDPVADIDPVLNTIFGQATPVEVTIGVEGSFAVGSHVAVLDALETDYEIKGPVDNMVGVSTKFQGTGGVLTGVSQHDLAEETVTGVSASVDSGASPISTLLGAMGLVHVTAISGAGATLTLTLQDSANNSSFADIITFPAITAVGSAWVVTATTATIGRYTRASWTIAGTSPHVTFQSSLARF